MISFEDIASLIDEDLGHALIFLYTLSQLLETGLEQIVCLPETLNPMLVNLIVKGRSYLESSGEHIVIV